MASSFHNRRANLLKEDKQVDETRRALPPGQQMAAEGDGCGEGPTAEHEAQVGEEERLLLEQQGKLAALQQELHEAHGGIAKAGEEIELLRRENAEILAELEGINGSLGWKLVKRYRKLKDHLLIPESSSRRFYDRLLVRLKGPKPETMFRSAQQRTTLSQSETVAGYVSEHADTDSRELTCCSIIVPVFNQAKFTAACLLGIEKSVSAKEIAYEVVVVDNGSTDRTADLLSFWSRSRPNARVLRFGENLGFARACNAGARASRGHYLVFLNNDTLPAPGWLETMERLARQDSQIGIVGSKLLFPDNRIQHIGVVFDQKRNPRHIYKGFSADINPAKVCRDYQAVTGACLLIKKDLYWTVGGMDEQYENSYEDIDLCLKVRASGYRVVMCGDSIVYHFEGTSQGRRASDFHNLALFKARWENKIDCDNGRLNALDNLRDESGGFEADFGQDSMKESLLEDLWERVYSCSFPNGIW
jgi:GT2 family glycosyltransferase